MEIPEMQAVMDKWVEEGATPLSTAEELGVPYNETMSWAAHIDWVALSYQVMSDLPITSDAVMKVPNALAFTTGLLIGLTIGPRVPDTLPTDWS